MTADNLIDWFNHNLNPGFIEELIETLDSLWPTNILLGFDQSKIASSLTDEQSNNQIVFDIALIAWRAVRDRTHGFQRQQGKRDSELADTEMYKFYAFLIALLYWHQNHYTEQSRAAFVDMCI